MQEVAPQRFRSAIRAGSRSSTPVRETIVVAVCRSSAPKPNPASTHTGARSADSATARAALLGGSLTAGPRPGGGFHVTALLPLPAGLPEGTPAP
ncbi:hypothetical protein ABTX77_32885 [Streptomyces sp. NPDC097704]|uniref:hypothetical protein n=1 Tax=Streptomyces sp. NPDC097704 TaxID=3157101 RepID=UPI00332578A9